MVTSTPSPLARPEKSKSGCSYSRSWSRTRSSRALAVSGMGTIVPPRNSRAGSLVPQSLNRIEPRSLDRGQHATDDSNEAQNRRRPNQGGGINVEMNISLARVFNECAPQRERTDGPGNEISQYHAPQPAQCGDH